MTTDAIQITIQATPERITAAVQKLAALYPNMAALKDLRLRAGHLDLDVDTPAGEVQARVELAASPNG